MNDASDASAVVDIVRLYFFVNVRNARGLSVVGGNIIGRTVGLLKLGAGIGAALRSGRARGVPKAGEEEGITGSEVNCAVLRFLTVWGGSIDAIWSHRNILSFAVQFLTYCMYLKNFLKVASHFGRRVSRATHGLSSMQGYGNSDISSTNFTPPSLHNPTNTKCRQNQSQTLPWSR